jgi:hypothetical protein
MISIEAAKAIMKGGLGEAELKLVATFAAPFYWVIRQGDGRPTTRNGTAFFLDAGNGPIGVTACHVIEGYLADCETRDVTSLRLGARAGNSLAIDWNARVIDADRKLDIATFSIKEAEVHSLERIILTGHQKEWPPKPPQEDRGIYYCGFAGVGTLQISGAAVSFGAVCGSGVASSISESDVSTLIDRQYLTPVLGEGVPPENFDFGGISGGPMITVTEGSLRGWALAGVIYEGPNPSSDPAEAIAGLDIIRARRAHFIRQDGTLDVALWNTLHI